MKDLVTAETRQGLLDTPGVHSVGDSIRGGEDVVVVHVRPDASAADVPASAEGVRVVVERDPMPTTLDATFRSGHRSRNRPVLSGTLTSTYDESGTSAGTGTLGFTLTDGTASYYTSNNHVWADNLPERIGDVVTQPSGEDNAIGELTDYHPLPIGKQDETTLVDLAWAKRGAPGATNRIPGLGTYSTAVVDPSPGDPVYLAGSKSGLVAGTVEEVNKSGGVLMLGDNGGTYSYKDCFAFAPPAAPGDSGAPVVLDDGEPYSPMGQAFAAGSDWTIAHRMSNVLAVTGFDVLGGPVGPQAPLYEGRPRSDYTYCGTEQDVFEQWVAGEISTYEFQSLTPSGEGTDALKLGECDDGNGDGGDDTPMYDGRPRSDYTYCGSQPEEFEQWVAGDLTTEEFQFQTPPGDGTAALTLGSCTREASVSPALLAGAGLLGAYYWYRNRQDT